MAPVQIQARLAKKDHIPSLFPEVLIVNKVYHRDKAITTEKDWSLSVLHPSLVELNGKDLAIKKSKESISREREGNP